MSPPGRRYQRLADQLAAQAAPAVTWRFAEIGERLGRSLPPVAYTRGWWQERSRALADTLRAAGWRVAAVDTFRGTVTFVRVTDTKQATDSTAPPESWSNGWT